MATIDNAFDLVIVTDATASMGSYLQALNNSLPEIIRISALTGCFSRIGVVAYRDYCGGKLTEWSDWHYTSGGHKTEGAVTKEALLAFARNLRPSHGGDWPEATKTGLACAYQHMREEVKTCLLLYTDAPPHTSATKGHNRIKEQEMLSQDSAFGPDSARFVDWVSAATTLAEGPKRAQVFSLVQSHLADTLAPYMYLCDRTGGACLQLPAACGAPVISKLTIGVLLAWMGVEKEGVNPNITKVADVCSYIDTARIKDVESEEDPLCKTFWVLEDKPDVVQFVKDNILEQSVTVDGLKQHIRARQSPMTDFSQRYRVDAAYRGLVVENLREIVENDIAAVTVNPVFGSLWRAVCNDRLNEARDGLIQAFGAKVERIPDAETKTRVKEWLEESYDYVGEITEIIASVPEGEKYPCVLLDPTLDFKPAPGDVEDETDPSADSSKFTRAELLEIGRSCDYRILRRMGRVLTRLTYVASEADLPAHIKAEPEAVVPRVPMALAEVKHGGKFFKILLHVILPGTMITARPAALLAALSLRMGIRPLQEAADNELLRFSTWNALDIPETWNTNCLSLVLEADKNYEGRVSEGTTDRRTPGAAFLKSEDRQLFQLLVDYKLLEINLGTTLTAKVGWHPEKTKAITGPTAVCKTCHFPRSVTVMGKDGVCGLCDEKTCNCQTPEAHAAFISENVTKDSTSDTKMAWVECCRSVCRAQYVVYNPQLLNVRAKCHYCRTAQLGADDRTKESAAPFVECRQCLSRVIWPVEYRPEGFIVSAYNCPACESGVATIVETGVTANDISSENGRDWLLRNDDNKIAEPFHGRSLFHVISTAGAESFAEKVTVLPGFPGDARFTLRGKVVRNPDAILAELRRWITSGRVQRETCSLCFETFKKGDLRNACGRKGCQQRICGGCHREWYVPPRPLFSSTRITRGHPCPHLCFPHYRRLSPPLMKKWSYSDHRIDLHDMILTEPPAYRTPLPPPPPLLSLITPWRFPGRPSSYLTCLKPC